jgi:hypothetical protein
VECGIVEQANSGSSITYCHNVGEISSRGSPIWDVFSSDVEVADCYYMADSETDEYDGTTYKTATEFADGTVLALLDNGNWEQGDDYPVLAKAKGVTVSGTVTRSNSDTDEVTVQLIPDGSSEVAYETVVKGNATSYSLSGVADGRYTLKVQAEGGRDRCYEITVAGESVCQDVSVVEYTVTFQNWDGSVITTATYFDGETVEVPADPVRQKDDTYTYTFSGWDQEVVPCTKDAVYTAVFTAHVRGVRVSGTVTSFGSDTDNVIVQLIAEGYSEADYEVFVKGNTAAYSIEGVAAGTYTLRVEKNNHVARTYTVTVGTDPVVQDAKIHLKGDIDGNGKINVGDTTKVYSHVKKTALITDEYMLLCADIDGNGKINVGDTTKVYAHVKKTNLLW